MVRKTNTRSFLFWKFLNWLFGTDCLLISWQLSWDRISLKNVQVKHMFVWIFIMDWAFEFFYHGHWTQIDQVKGLKYRWERDKVFFLYLYWISFVLQYLKPSCYRFKLLKILFHGKLFIVPYRNRRRDRIKRFSRETDIVKRLVWASNLSYHTKFGYASR